LAILAGWSLADRKLFLRFTPDYFDFDFVDPVLVLETEIEGKPKGLEQQIQIIKEGLIDDVEVDETKKQQMSRQKNNEYDRQIELLRRVRRKLKSDT
jgi:hypothetical protein